MKIKYSFYVIGFLMLGGCIGFDIVDDEVEPVVIILNPIDSLKIGDSYQLNSKYLNEVGVEEAVDINWSTSNDQIISISTNGLAEALTLGEATIIAEHNFVADTLLVYTGQTTSIVEQIRTANLSTVSSYPLSGTATLEIKDGITILRFEDDFATTSALPGLYVYLSNNTNTTAGAYEVGAVTNFSGAQEYTINSTVRLNDFSIVLFFCKPFNVAVGYGVLNP